MDPGEFVDHNPAMLQVCPWPKCLTPGYSSGAIPVISVLSVWMKSISKMAINYKCLSYFKVTYFLLVLK